MRKCSKNIWSGGGRGPISCISQDQFFLCPRVSPWSWKFIYKDRNQLLALCRASDLTSCTLYPSESGQRPEEWMAIDARFTENTGISMTLSPMF